MTDSNKAVDTAAARQMEAYPDKAKAPLAASAPAQLRPGITFAAQESLPKLPIPDLASTTQRYLDALEPLQDQRSHDETKACVDEFLHHDGPSLQDRLKEYARGETSYIEQFWYDSYLNFDNPVVLNLNPFFLLEDDPTPARNNQVTRAASLVVSALSFVRAVRREELPPDTLRGQPLDMYQYSRLFATARIPTDNGCRISVDTDSKHIVVLSHGQFYWFDVLDANADLIMTEKNLSQNLQTIVDDASLTPLHEAAKGALGVLSTENRKTWSGLRTVLSDQRGSNNADCLDIVDTALFVVCLDYTEPSNAADLCMNMLCGTSDVEKGVQVGTCTNRWYDKMQIIVCKNGSAGINFEHTGVDGHTVLRFASDVYTDTILRFARTINGQAPSLWASSSPDPSKRDPASFGDVTTTPHKLEWDMGPELSTALRFAETRLADLIQQNEFATLEFSQYGKNFMTSMGFSPDAFVQMAFQAAYYGLYGRMECVYEPAMTKIYYHGRTEAIRSVTNESTNFVRTFWGENPIDAKLDALRKACQKHTEVTKVCAKAQGQDRHLYALYCVWQRSLEDDHASNPDDSRSSPARKENGHRNHTPNHIMPSIFSDPGWDKLGNAILSTSNCGNPCLRHFGFGPTSGDGFGIGYIIKDGSVSICASSKHRQTKRFVSAIESYFVEMRKLLRQAAARDKAASTALGQKISRGHEVEALQQPVRDNSTVPIKRGRKINAPTGTGAVSGGPSRGSRTPTTASTAADNMFPVDEDDDDQGMGGYGFFDAGLLLSALKGPSSASKGDETNETSASSGAKSRAPSSTREALVAAAAAASRRREVGKKLSLAEY